MTGERLIVGAAIAGGVAGAFICIALESSGWVSGVFGGLGLLLLAGIAAVARRWWRSGAS